VLNLQIQENQGYLLFSSAISGLIYTYSNPPIVKEIISKLPPEYISFEGAWFCLSALIIGAIWKNNVRDIAVKYFTYLALTESITAFLLSIYLVFIKYNVWIFAISTLLYSSIITTFIGKCIMMFESKLWNGKERELFDNTSSIFRNGVAMLGFAIAILAMPKLNTAILLWGIGCIFDDIGWIIVYRKTRKRLVEK
jgi:hypothetical protein